MTDGLSTPPEPGGRHTQQGKQYGSKWVAAHGIPISIGDAKRRIPLPPPVKCAAGWRLSSGDPCAQIEAGCFLGAAHKHPAVTDDRRRPAFAFDHLGTGQFGVSVR